MHARTHARTHTHSDIVDGLSTLTCLAQKGATIRSISLWALSVLWPGDLAYLSDTQYSSKRQRCRHALHTLHSQHSNAATPDSIQWDGHARLTELND